MCDLLDLRDLFAKIPCMGCSSMQSLWVLMKVQKELIIVSQTEYFKLVLPMALQVKVLSATSRVMTKFSFFLNPNSWEAGGKFDIARQICSYLWPQSGIFVLHLRPTICVLLP